MGNLQSLKMSLRIRKWFDLLWIVSTANIFECVFNNLSKKQNDVCKNAKFEALNAESKTSGRIHGGYVNLFMLSMSPTHSVSGFFFVS